MRKSEKNAFFSKPLQPPILISWNPVLYTFLCTKIKKFTMDNFFSLDACSRPMCAIILLGTKSNQTHTKTTDYQGSYITAGHFHCKFTSAVQCSVLNSHLCPKERTHWLSVKSRCCYQEGLNFRLTL